MMAAEVMTRTIISIGPDASVREAVRLMLDNRVSGLPVVDPGGRMVGILTEGDLLRRSEIGTDKHRRHWLEFLMGPGRMAGDYVRTHGRRVEEIMTREVTGISPDTPLDEIVQLMERRHIKRLPVLAGEALVGIVTRADLLAALARALDAHAAPPAATPAGDDEIRERIVAELAKAEWAPRSGLTISVKGGVVGLDGVVFDEEERAALRVAAENVPGVKAIEDHMVWVEPVSGTVIEPPAEGEGAVEPKPR